MTDMFKQETPADQGIANTQTNVQPDALATLLSEIRNEHGEQKYKNPFEALKALKHSQEYIPQQRNELAAKDQELERLRQENARIRELEDSVRQLTQRQEAPPTKGIEFDESKLEQLIRAQMTRADAERLAADNQRTVEAALSKHFGEKASEVFFGKAREMGMAPEDIQSLSAKSPAAVLALFGVSGSGAHKQPNMTPTQTRVNSAAVQPSSETSYIGRETETIPLGGGQRELSRMMDNARGMVDELRSKGMTIDDLTNPVNYFKIFN